MPQTVTVTTDSTKPYLLTVVLPLLIVSYEILAYLSNDMYLPAEKNLIYDFNIPIDVAYLTLTTWFLGTMSLQLVVGPMVEYYGRRACLLGSAVLFIASNLLCTITTNFTVFLLARYLQGTIVCVIIVVGYGLMHELLERHKAITTIAWMGSVTILAPAAGPLLGSLILKVASWRAVFGCLLAAGIPVIMGLYWCLKHVPRTKHADVQCVAISGKFIVDQYHTIISNKNFMLYTACYCLIVFNMFFWINIGPLLVTVNFAQTDMYFSVAQAIIFASNIVAIQLLRLILPRLGVARVITLGLSIIASGWVLAWSLGYYYGALWCLILGLLGNAFGNGLAAAALQRLVMEELMQVAMSYKIAILSFLVSVTAVIASYISGILLQYTIVYVIGVSMLSALIAWLLYSCILRQSTMSKVQRIEQVG